jgi:hypothetical protein
MNRYETYQSLMTDREHWQKTFAIISCKIIRENHPEEFHLLIDYLNDR